MPKASIIADILSFLESEIPANPDAVKNQKYEKAMMRTLEDYFQALHDAFPYDKLDDLYYRYIAQESLGRDSDNLLNPILFIFQRKLSTEMDGHYVTAYLAGSAQMIEWGKTQKGLSIVYEGPPLEDAIKYAKERTATLIKGMNDTSREQIRNIIADGIKNKRGIPGIEKDIRDRFKMMKQSRSVTIARTESCDALEQAFIDRAIGMGINGKEWVVTQPCEICQKNDGIQLLIDQEFPTGHQRPPAHPNCRCALAPVIIK